MLMGYLWNFDIQFPFHLNLYTENYVLNLHKYFDFKYDIFLTLVLNIFVFLVEPTKFMFSCLFSLEQMFKKKKKAVIGVM